MRRSMSVVGPGGHSTPEANISYDAYKFFELRTFVLQGLHIKH
jgi:hypothetical protein